MSIHTFSNTNLAYDPDSDPLDSYFVTLDKLKSKIKSLNNKKFSGPDNIPNIAIKNLPNCMLKCLTIILNNALNFGYFPTAWKKDKVIALLKKGKPPNNPTSYRPISLLSNLGKLFETIINDNLMKQCSKLNLIPGIQFGFKKRHSTMHAVHKLISEANWVLSNKLCMGACLIDLEKAFDSVWTEGLLSKLLNKKVPRYLVKLTEDFSNNRSFKVFNHDGYSEKNVLINNSLPQGAINFPILFNIFTNDLLTLYDNHKVNCHLMAFADDLIVYC